MESIRKFNNMAELVKDYRNRTCLAEDMPATTQGELAHALGYKNGQFVSNVERGLCGVPVDKWDLLSKTLRIPLLKLKAAYLADHADNMDRELQLVRLNRVNLEAQA